MIEEPQLSNTTNVSPQMEFLTPRWLLRLLPWINVDSGIYRIKHIKIIAKTKKLTNPLKTKINNKEDCYFVSDLLKNIPLFRSIPDELMKDILNGLYQKLVKPGDEIARQGEPGNKFYIVTDGQFDVSIKGIDGKDLLLKSLGNGDYFGEMALLEDAPRQATITATTKGSLICLNKETFLKAIGNTQLKEELYKVLKERKAELELSSKYGEVQTTTVLGHSGEPIPQEYSDYIENSMEIHLSLIQVIVGLHIKTNDPYGDECQQLEQRLKVTIENIREREEWEIINNKEFGLMKNIAANMTIDKNYSPLTPDDLDELIALVWKNPSFFLAHPRAIAAFGRECNNRNITLTTVKIFESNFYTWRGIPIIPSDKLIIDNSNDIQSTDIILMRTGEEIQGVVGLRKESASDVRYMGINDQSISNYLVTKHFSVAVLVPDAIAKLKNVKIFG